jgi:predicted Zn-dependent peptidase
VAKHELYFGRPFSLDEIQASIDGVSAEEVDALIARLFGAAPPSLVALGPDGATVLPGDLAF